MIKKYILRLHVTCYAQTARQVRLRKCVYVCNFMHMYIHVYACTTDLHVQQINNTVYCMS